MKKRQANYLAKFRREKSPPTFVSLVKHAMKMAFFPCVGSLLLYAAISAAVLQSYREEWLVIHSAQQSDVLLAHNLSRED